MIGASASLCDMALLQAQVSAGGASVPGVALAFDLNFATGHYLVGSQTGTADAGLPGLALGGAHNGTRIGEDRLEPAGERVRYNDYPHTIGGWSAQGALITGLETDSAGFEWRRIASAGDETHSDRLSFAVSWASGDCVVIKARYRASTHDPSGQFGLYLFDPSDTQCVGVAGPVGALSVTREQIGDIEGMTQNVVEDGAYELELVVRLNRALSLAGLDAGPSSSSGSVEFAGAQVTDGPSDWIFHSPDQTGVSAYFDRRVLVEAEATNRLLYSEDFVMAPWSPSNGGGVSQNGSMLGRTRFEITASSSNNAQVSQQLDASPGETLAMSVFVAAGSLSELELRLGLSGNYVQGFFDVSTGTALSGHAGSGVLVGLDIEEVVTGVFGCQLAGSGLGSGTKVSAQIYPGTGGTATPGSIFASAAQVETGSFATSYIATHSQAVTRSGDIKTLDVAGLGLADDISAEVTYGDGSTGTINAVAGVLTLMPDTRGFSQVRG